MTVATATMRQTPTMSKLQQHPQPPCLTLETVSWQRIPASWSDLPEPLVATILGMVFRDSGGALQQWLQLILVCRHAPCSASRPPSCPVTSL